MTTMSFAMIPIAPDVLARLLALQQTDQESFNDILRRVLVDRVPGGASPNPPSAPATVHYTLLGEEHGARDATEALLAILARLSEGDGRFFEVLAAKVKGRSRNHVARTRADVYPDRPDLAKSAKQVAPGWFIGCNIANREKERILRAACQIAGLAFGRDLFIALPNA